MPDVSDIIRRMFQPGGQVAAEPRRRADSSKNQVRGRGNVQRTLRSPATSGTARPVAGTSPRLLLAAVSEEQGLLLLAEIGPERKKEPETSPARGAEGGVRGWGNPKGREE